MTAPETTSTRPYLLRALFEWCTDNGLTPHIAVRVDRSTQVSSDIIGTAEQRITDNQQLIAQLDQYIVQRVADAETEQQRSLQFA